MSTWWTPGNARDLDKAGRVLQMVHGGPFDVFDDLGQSIWSDWKEQIAKNNHPPRAMLIAFARGWSAPGAEWLPELTRYLADRLDPDEPTPDRGGRPPKSELERHHEWVRSVGMAIEVVQLTSEGYSEEDAISEVADRLLLDDVDVKIALDRHPDTAEKLAGTAAAEQFTRELARDD